METTHKVYIINILANDLYQGFGPTVFLDTAKIDSSSSYIQLMKSDLWISETYPALTISFKVKFPNFASDTHNTVIHRESTASIDVLMLRFHFYANGSLHDLHATIQDKDRTLVYSGVSINTPGNIYFESNFEYID